jgi:tyrosyl-tRNA synthetase
MQGRDSVEIEADVELGGSEQLYNLLVGRDLQADARQEPQICITLPILKGLDGEKKMGKSLGNYIGVAEPPQSKFDKTMSIPDTLLRSWFELLTDRSHEEIAALLDPARTTPFEAKKTLAADVVAFYHGADEAAAARAEWEKTKSLRQDPTEIREETLPAASLVDGKIGVVKLLVHLGFASSNSDARRLVTQGAVTVGPDREKLTDPNAQLVIGDGLVVRVGGGGRKIARVRLG